MSAAASEDSARFLRKRSFSIAGHRTSVALEPEFWTVLEKEARRSGQSLSGLVARVDTARDRRPLASALRLAALQIVGQV